MEKRTLKILFATMVFLSVAIGLVVMASMMSPSTVQTTAQTSIPIELEVTAEPSTIKPGETAVVIVRLIDENNRPVATEVEVQVNLSANGGSVEQSTLAIPAGENSAKTQFTSETTGIAVIYAKSKGFISDSTSIVIW